MNESNTTQRSTANEVLDALFHQIKVWRVELLLITPPIVLAVWLYSRAGLAVAVAALVALVALALGVANPRHVIFGVLHRSSVRRHLETAFASLPGILGERPPAIKSITRTNFGDRAELLLAKGTSIEDLAKMESKLASSLSVRQVRCRANESKRNVVTLSITRDDPFAEETPSPLLKVARTCFWDATDLGVNEEGEVTSVPLVGRHAMLGGESGSGKSVTLNQLVASAALDPETDLWLFDGKGVDLTIWRNCANAYVSWNLADAVANLERLVSLMEQHYEQLRERGLVKITRDAGLRLQVVVVDELTVFLAGPDKVNSKRCYELLRDLVARGRAAGFVVLTATQRPSTDIVPSSLRDLFGLRWALRCATRDSSDTILGVGWAAEGYSASLINASARGVGFVLYDGVPEKLRSFTLSDDDLVLLAQRAERLRR
jgi:DNA segregation ATPase FtsK/SpoIIIE-like protein